MTSVQFWATVGGTLATLMGGGGIVTLVKVILDRRAGVRGEERAARRDMIADRDGLIQTLLDRAAALEARVGNVEHDNDALRLYNITLTDHIDVLEAFIYAVHRGEAQPPPPARPTPPPIPRKEAP